VGLKSTLSTPCGGNVDFIILPAAKSNAMMNNTVDYMEKVMTLLGDQAYKKPAKITHSMWNIELLSPASESHFL
jgi:hypothetical protein